MERKQKRPADNGRFGKSGAVTRRTICAENHRLYLVAISVEAATSPSRWDVVLIC